jgi:hypothetical protein
MAVNVKWHIEPKIVLVENQGKISSSETEGVIHQLFEMITGAPGKVHIIIDVENLDGIQITNPLTNPEAMKLMKHPNRGWAVLTGSSNQVLNFWLETFSKIGGLSYKLMSNVKDATQFLLDMDKIAEQRGNEPATPKDTA